MKINKQILIIASALLIVVVMSVSYVSAYQLLCLTHGQKLPPAPVKTRYTCDHDTCQVCVTNHYFPTDIGLCWNQANCNAYNPGNGSNNNSIDTKAPVLTVNSPTQNGKYNIKNVLFDLKTDETATFYYLDNNNGKGAYIRLAALTTSYLKSVSFKDGQQNITIKAVDTKGNPTTKNVVFWVDSTKPKITKTFPTKGFASGTFEVLFTEANPNTVTLQYGNTVKGIRYANVDLTKCSIDGAGKYDCTLTVPITDYNNQDLYFMFKLTDIVGNYVESKPVTLKVDTTAPIINNPSSIIKVSGKSVDFNMSITEQNFQDVLYMDNSASNPKWQKLCTSLKKGICEKKVTFSKDDHIVDLKVEDQAGNSVTRRVEFNINK